MSMIDEDDQPTDEVARQRELLAGRSGDPKSKTFNVLAELFGDKGRLSQVDQQQAISNARRVEQDAIASEDREMKRLQVAEQDRDADITKSLAVIAQAEERGIPIDEDFFASFPQVTSGLGIDADNVADIIGLVQQNPGMAASLYAAQVGKDTDKAATNRNVGAVFEMDVPQPDGTVKRIPMQARQQGGPIPVGGTGTLTANRFRRERAEQGALRLDPTRQGDIAEEKGFGKALGKGAGEIAVEDLPTSKTAIASQRSKVRTQFASTDRALAALQKAREQASTMSTGFIGGTTKILPGTPAFNLEKRVIPAVAQAFATNLQNMREMSKTGGAVGNVSDAEGERMAAMDASLEIGQGKEQLLEQIAVMEEAIRTSRENVRLAFEEDQAARAVLTEGSDTASLLQKYGIE